MKKLIVILGLMFTVGAQADLDFLNQDMSKAKEQPPVVCTPAPVPVKVKRKYKRKPIKKVIECTKEVAEKVVEKTVEREVRVSQKNHLRILGGIGPTGVGRDVAKDVVSLTRNNKAVFGVAYGRNVSERWSVEATALTNGTALVGVGYNW